MNRRLFRRAYSDYQRDHRRRFLRTSVVGFGFLSGLWAHLGVDPGTMVAKWLEAFLLTIDPAHSAWISLAFLYGPTLLLLIAIVLIYRRAGLLGFVAVGLAYVAGLLLNTMSIPLMLLALVIGWFSARRVY